MDVIIQFAEFKKIAEVDRRKMQQWRDVGITLGQSDITEKIKIAYRANTLPSLELLRTALIRQDVDSLKRQLQRIGASSGTVGFLRLQRMSEFLEELISKSEDPIKIMDALLPPLEKELVRSLHLLDKL